MKRHQRPGRHRRRRAVERNEYLAAAAEPQSLGLMTSMNPVAAVEARMLEYLAANQVPVSGVADNEA